MNDIHCRSKRTPAPARRNGFTLMEVILALAILGGGLAILNEAIRIAQRCERMARDLRYAQMLCEEKMNEISSGMTSSDPASGVSFGDAYQGWLYSVETGGLDVPGLIAVSVTVTQDLPPEREPVVYSMVRWLSDPATATSSDSTNSSTSQNSSSSSGTSNNSSSTGTSGGTTK